MHRETRIACKRDEAREVHMRGEIGAAWRVEDVHPLMYVVAAAFLVALNGVLLWLVLSGA